MPIALFDLLSALDRLQFDAVAEVQRERTGMQFREYPNGVPTMLLEAYVADPDSSIESYLPQFDAWHKAGWIRFEILPHEDRSIPVTVRRPDGRTVTFSIVSAEDAGLAGPAFEGKQAQYAMLGSWVFSEDSDPGVCRVVTITEAGLRELQSMRLAGMVASTAEGPGKPPSRASMLRVEPKEMRAYWSDVELSINPNAEFKVLRRLHASFGEVVPYSDLLKTVKPSEIVAATVEANREAPPEVKGAVSRIRRAFEKANATLAISVVRGNGYRLEVVE